MVIAFRNTFVFSDVIEKDVKQDRQCTYIVILRRIRATTVAVERK